ncbi:RNA polymerase sigma factor [Desulfonema ishimotonii]|uniref:RNA polymerase sigma factor n=1 Tax=Desulfonema ishimotonii TaxID=45657 RepID=A0A401G365_9BACT|nr:RNA polymerase sigma factor [Desulfonema ishimotonii]GBC63688.1 RNA polymerase sigma factor [Desulfonema ishimotonii]
MKNNPDPSGDEAVIDQIIAGDANAFEVLLKKYEHLVSVILKKHLPYEQVEETAQEVFIRAYRSLPSFKKKSSFKSWLSSIAIRTCYDFWRKRYRSRELPMSALSEAQQDWLDKVISDQSGQSFEALGRQTEAREVLDWALGQLSAEDRMVLELVYLEGFSGKEAAKLLGWSVANVKIRTFRSRKKLHRLLTGFAQDEGKNG